MYQKTIGSSIHHGLLLCKVIALKLVLNTVALSVGVRHTLLLMRTEDFQFGNEAGQESAKEVQKAF